MNFKKITLNILVSALLASSLWGCSDEKNIISYESGTTEKVPEESPKISKENISSVLLLPDDPSKGACMSAAHESAFTSAAKELGIDAKVVICTDAERASELAENANVVFGAGFGFMNPFDDASKTNTDKLYACFGGYKYNSYNYTNYNVAVYEAQYLAGIAAGTNSKSGKIGVISEYTTEYPDSAAEINSFTLGAKSVNPDVQVIVRSLGSRTDTSKAEEYTHALIAEKCDVISIQCDTSIPADIASKKEVYFIGYGIDLKSHGKEFCLASILWDLKDYYTAALTSASDGTWAHENFSGNLSNGAISLSDFSATADPITGTRIDSAASLIKDEFFEIFSNHSMGFNTEGKAHTVKSALTDNKSNIMISEDGNEAYLYSGEDLKAIDPAAVTSDNLASANMNYLVAGVTVRE